MFNKRTTFIIGAGASLELGFPTSYLLKKQISSAVDIKYDDWGSRIVSGDTNVANALEVRSGYKTSRDPTEYNKYLKAGWHTAKAMPQAISIDNFIEAQEDKYVTEVSKLGIASCIISAEEKCWKTYFHNKQNSVVDWSLFENNWIHYLFQKLNEGLKKRDLEKIFSNVEFIVFNYDRSLEFFLGHCIANYYEIQIEDSWEILAQAKFYHPYGQTGRLPWQNRGTTALDFGIGRKNNLSEIADSLLTFSEQIEDEDSLHQIRSAVADAEQLIFLGFAYHEPNMALMLPKKRNHDANIIATAYGFSEPDLPIIRESLKNLSIEKNDAFYGKSGAITLDNTAKCSDLFTKYGKVISA